MNPWHSSESEVADFEELCEVVTGPISFANRDWNDPGFDPLPFSVENLNFGRLRASAGFFGTDTAESPGIHY